MNDKVRKNLTTKIKERWELAEKLAKILKYRKDCVYNKMSEFDIEGILNNKRKPYNEAIAILQRYTAVPPILYESQRESRPIQKESRPQPEEDKCDEAMSQLRIMLWAIKKIGDPDTARKAFNRAYNLKKDLLEEG